MSALTLSLLVQFPFIKKLWGDAMVKLAILALPIYLAFVARGTAASWMGDLLGTGAVNTGSAFFAATTFLLCLIAGTLLAIAALISEVAIPFIPLARGAAGTCAKKRLYAGRVVACYQPQPVTTSDTTPTLISPQSRQ